MIGKTLGPYQIVSQLGEGGMGAVYRAYDPRLGRYVALKVLLDDFAASEERLKRFDREACAAASLSHPHIVSIFDFGKIDSTPFVVMELVRGNSLRELLAGGPLPIHDLLKFSVQITYGLAAAHEAGIVHRDLKPANIMVTTDRFIKIMDFGLAKIMTGGALKSDKTPTNPNLAGSLTPSLAVMGTPAYMSPEQAKGQPIDFRSDQFALGTIMYEMATGKNPFSRGNWVEEMVAICGEEPEPVGKLNSAIPRSLESVVSRCMSKNALLRYPATREIAFDLDHLRLMHTIETLGFKRGSGSSPAISPEQAPHLHRVIGTAKDEFPVQRAFGKLRDSGFGNLVTDAMRSACGTQIAIINSQALRAPSSKSYLPVRVVQPTNNSLRRTSPGFSAGPPYDLVVGDVLFALPFPDKVVSRTVTGSQLHNALEHSLSGGTALQVSGFRFAYDSSRPHGSQVLWAKLDTGEHILPDATPYTATVTDFLNSGGDGLSMLADGSGSVQGLLTDAVIKYIEKLGVVAPVEEGRILDSQE